MDLLPLNSSHLRGVGYDEDRGVLVVQFRDGSTYEYDGVSKETFQDLLNAPSHGKHFFASIKSVFDGKRIA